VKHLRYLYWTHNSRGATAEPLQISYRTSLWVINHRGEKVHDDEDLYFQANEECGAQVLLVPASEDELEDEEELEDDEESQDKDVNVESLGSFMHPDYLTSPPVKNEPKFPSWETWLEECLGVLKHPRFVDPKDSFYQS
jgi:hypothetical protein